MDKGINDRGDVIWRYHLVMSSDEALKQETPDVMPRVPCNNTSFSRLMKHEMINSYLSKVILPVCAKVHFTEFATRR